MNIDASRRDQADTPVEIDLAPFRGVEGSLSRHEIDYRGGSAKQQVTSNKRGGAAVHLSSEGRLPAASNLLPVTPHSFDTRYVHSLSSNLHLTGWRAGDGWE